MKSGVITLRSIELAGFKSFAKRTKVEFGSGLVAIVGPNGSGKSNIADAIRFLSIDSIVKAGEGHQGVPLGMAEIATAMAHTMKGVVQIAQPFMDLFMLLVLLPYKVTLESMDN